MFHADMTNISMRDDEDLPYMFVDTGAWYALLDKDDANHHAAVTFKDSLVHPLMTSNYIVDEVLTLARNRLSHKVAVEIGQKLWDESLLTLSVRRHRMRKRHRRYL